MTFFTNALTCRVLFGCIARARNIKIRHFKGKMKEHILCTSNLEYLGWKWLYVLRQRNLYFCKFAIVCSVYCIQYTVFMQCLLFFYLLHPIFRLFVLFYIFYVYIVQFLISCRIIRGKYGNIHRILFFIYLKEQTPVLRPVKPVLVFLLRFLKDNH